MKTTPHNPAPNTASGLKDQVCRMLNHKIKRIAQSEHSKTNPISGKRYQPYSVPECVDLMVSMLGRIETASGDELEAMALYATTGEVRELSQYKARNH